MRAIRVHEFGGPEVLQCDELPLPEPGPGEARVKLEAIGVNFIDIYHRSGAYKGGLPLTLGQEAAGTVEAVGPGVSELQPGARVVYASVQGAYADFAIVPAVRLVPIPAGLSTELTCASFLQGLTAHYLAFSTFPLKPGQTALVHAAAGGLGQLLVQVAKRLGARVLGTVSTEAKAAFARAAGADEVILYTQVDFEAEVKRLTDGQGVDVVYDSVGKTTFEKGLNCLRRRGMMVLCGQSSGAVPPLDPQSLNARGSLYLTRPTLAHYTADRAELLWRANDLLGWLAAGELKVRIDSTFPLTEAGAAQTHLASRASSGKVLLLP
jgi:NADPH2:quinone reductase